MLAALWVVADAAEEGRKVVLSMLVVGLDLHRRDRARRARRTTWLGEAQGREARPAAVADRGMAPTAAAF